jgi:hypothetical protein
MPDADPVIEFSVRQLLAEIRTELGTRLSEIRAEQASGFSRLETRLESKADKTDVAKLQSDFAHLGTRLESLEQRQRAADIEEKARKSLVEEEHEKSEFRRTRDELRRTHRQWYYGIGIATVSAVGAALIEALIR